MTATATATRRRATPKAAPKPTATARPLWLPVGFTLLLAAFMLLPQLQANPNLMRSFGFACAALALWAAALWVKSGGRALRVDVSLRPQHYLQAIAHCSIFVYWGFYWDPIKDAASLIAAQIVFAYAFDMLLSWSRRDDYTFGFGPFPIIFSTNLFLRFHDDWFYLQFVMVAVGFLAKELIRWDKGGRRVHVFNPSSFPLALASLLLIVTHTTYITWGEEIATQLFLPPHIFLFIFLVSLPGQYKFGVSVMTLSAVVTTYAFGLLYFAVTGTYFFIDDYIPIAVFLGMHLLFTDPSTSPRSELGRIIYGVMYGLGVTGLYSLLAAVGAPTFYDKLLPVPIMNLFVQAIDRAVASPALAWANPARIGSAWPQMRRNLVYTSVWIVVFTGMTFAKGVGDHHPGHYVPFWMRACQDGKYKACDVLAQIETRYCADGSGWSCNELGIAMLSHGGSDRANAPKAFERACALGLAAGCANQTAASGATMQHGDPGAGDYTIVLREGKGALPQMAPPELFRRACDQGWVAGCGSLGLEYLLGRNIIQDRGRGRALLTDACDRGNATSCSNLGFMYQQGDGVPPDNAKAMTLLKRACDLGMADACRWLKTE